jgi:hypothetical protein
MGRREMDELRVGWIGPLTDGLRVGITLLPGRHDVSPGGHARDIDSDLATLKRHGVQQLLLLSDDEELEATGTSSLPSRARGAGFRVVRRPIRRERLPSMIALSEMIQHVSPFAGGTVIVCRTGLGRSGAVGAAWLLQSGKSTNVADALAAVRKARGPDAAGRPEYALLVLRCQVWRDAASGTTPAPSIVIPSDELRLESLPEKDAPWWPDLSDFALTFRGYDHIAGDGNHLVRYAGTIEERMGGGFPPPKTQPFPRGLSLTDFRLLLFRVQRDVHWGDPEPGEEYPPPELVEYARRLVGEIRRILREDARR